MFVSNNKKLIDHSNNSLWLMLLLVKAVITLSKEK